LQHKATYANQPIFHEAIDKFNNYDISAGKIIKDHPFFHDIKIDEPNISGLLTADKAYDMLKTVRKKYADVILPNFQSSGNHSSFDNFIQGDIDVLYLHYWIEHLKLSSITEFFSEGSTLDFSMETSTPSSTSKSVSIPSSSASAKSPGGLKRKKGDSMMASISTYFDTKRDILMSTSETSDDNTLKSLEAAYVRRRGLAAELNQCNNDAYIVNLKLDIEFENELIKKLKQKIS
jgi:hypothetical protein